MFTYGGPPANLNFLSATGGVVAFLLAQFLSSSAFTVSCHLLFDFHALVELDFCHATVALRVAFFFDGVEYTTEFGEPLREMG